ncbi:MAG TPA: FAD-dependent monooxygenase, partial [candidate division Zixibacteria bacterium]|nr:FAD-dependent monooxygenase [candidate division Zixibacteria bacterium]
DDNEKLLGEKYRLSGGSIQWGQELIGLEQKSDHVIASLKKADGSNSEIRANWVAGCDGGKSSVRQLNGIDFVGAPYEQVFFVADTIAQGAMVPNRLNVYMWKNGFHLFFPLRGENHWRIVGILPVELRHKDDLKFEAVVPYITQVAGTSLAFKECKWFSTYRIHHRRAAKFKNGRCFLLGDAAHVHSPVGGQGMNTGLQDAYNLAWKLALVISGRADENLLDTYEQERIPIADRLLKTTDQAFKAIVSDGWLAKMFRTQIYPKIIALVMRHSRVRRLAFDTVSQLGIHYPNTSLSQNLNGLGSKSPRAGDRFPWLHLKFSLGSAAEDVFKKFGDSNFTLVTFGQTSPIQLADNYGELIGVFQIPEDPANSSELRRVNIPNQSFYLIRPDGYIGLTGSVLSNEVLEKYLKDRMALN